jgi:hypothetical protein
MSGGGGSHHRQEVIAEALAKQMVGGNNSRLAAANPWIESQGSRYAQDLGQMPDALFSLWVPVPMGAGSFWKLRDSHVLASGNSKEPATPLLHWLEFLFLFTESHGALSTPNAPCPLEPYGTPSFSISNARCPRLYESLLEAYCVTHGKVPGCRPKNEDHDLVRRFTNRVSPMFEPRINDDLAATVASMEMRLAGKNRRKGGGEQEEQTQNAPAAPTDQGKKKCVSCTTAPLAR